MHRLAMIECCGNPADTGAGSGRAVCSVPGGYACPPVASMPPASQTSNAFVLANPPLAALHNMTEMKMPPAAALLSHTPSAGAGYGSPSIAAAAAAAAAVAANTFGMAAQNVPSWLTTPHGISDILGRPMCHFGLTSLNARMYLNSSAARFAAATAAAAAAAATGGQGKPELVSPSSVYWPGVLQAPAWRGGPGD